MGNCCKEINEQKSELFSSSYSFGAKSNLVSSIGTNKIKKIGKYNLICQIGAGAFGVIFNGYSDDNPGVSLAIKVVRKKDLQEEQMNKLFMNEVSIMRKIQHPNIIHLEELLSTELNYYIVMKYYSSGNLTDVIYNKKDKRLHEKEALFYLKQIMNGFKELRKNEVMHRDFKPENIFIGDNNLLVIGDLGFAKIINGVGNHTILGSPLTMAPEVLFEKQYGSKADLYSIGTVFYFMLFGKYPFFCRNIEDLKKNILLGVAFPGEVYITRECKDLLTCLLEANPVKRINWDNFFNHKIFHAESSIHLSVIGPDIEKYFRRNQLDKDNLPAFKSPEKIAVVKSNFVEVAEEEYEIKKSEILILNGHFCYYYKIIEFFSSTRIHISINKELLSYMKDRLFMLEILLLCWEFFAIEKFINILESNSKAQNDYKIVLTKKKNLGEIQFNELKKIHYQYQLENDDLQLLNTVSAKGFTSLIENEIKKKITNKINLLLNLNNKIDSKFQQADTLKILAYNIILKVLYCINYKQAFPQEFYAQPLNWNSFQDNFYIWDGKLAQQKIEEMQEYH